MGFCLISPGFIAKQRKNKQELILENDQQLNEVKPGNREKEFSLVGLINAVIIIKILAV